MKISLFMHLQRFFIVFLFSLFNCLVLFSQPKPIEKLTHEDITSMSFDELSAYSLEDIMKIAEKVGITTDDLFNMLLNKDVSIASKQDESYFDTPLSTSVLTAEDIRRSGALSIPEALRLLPGVIVREKTNGNYDVHLRSSNNIAGQQSLFSENTLTLVMLDGREVYTYVTGGTFWESLPIGLVDIERIEVIRGAASAMYGANAVTGVINIITKKTSSERVSVEANISTGGYTDPPVYSPAVGGVGTQSLSASFNLNEKFKFRLSGNYSYRDRVQSDIYFFLSERLQVSEPVYYPVDSVVIQGSDSKEMFKNPNRGLQAYGVNGLMSYVINPDIYFDLTTGLQRSTAISSNLDFYFFAHTTRQMETQYFNLRSKIYGFNIQAGYMWGYGDMAMGIPGLKSDMGNFNLNIDYNYRWNNININPGFYFAYNTMNGDKSNQSFFEGKQVLRSYAPSLRLDYTPCDQLRFIGALRLEKNEVPDKAYLTWQLAGIYKFNENSLIRAVYSRANRSPFMMDVRINSNVSLDFGQLQTSPDDPKNIVSIGMRGDENLKLAIMDMYELGYRQKIGNHILLNVELFHSRIKDLNAAELKEMRVTFGDPQVLRFYPYLMDFSFENISDRQEQTGGTIEIGVVANKQLSFRLWGTLQHTEIKKHNRNSSTMMKLGEVFAGAVISGRLNDYKVDDNDYRFLDTDLTRDMVDVKSESTPSFYGGYEMIWKVGKKISLFSSGYGFTEQSYANQFYSMDIQSKMLINAKIGYHFVENATLSLSVNNILNATSQEYGFMDKVGTQWYLGLNVKF